MASNGGQNPFEACPHCGTPVVHLAAHRCRDDDPRTQPTRKERLERIRDDDRPDDDKVLIVPKRNKSGNSYSYHEYENGSPMCGGSGGTPTEDYIQITRCEAKRRARSPCMSCLKLTASGA